jgi:hypothetical protein
LTFAQTNNYAGKKVGNVVLDCQWERSWLNQSQFGLAYKHIEHGFKHYGQASQHVGQAYKHIGNTYKHFGHASKHVSQT